MIYGSVFHAGLAKALRGEKLDLWEFMTPYLNGTANEQGWDGKIVFGDKDIRPDNMIAWLEEAANLILSQKTRPQATELKLIRNFDGFKLVGVVDCLWNGVLIDWKVVGKFYKPDVLQACIYGLLNGGPSQFQFWCIYKEKAPRLEILTVKEANDRKYLEWITTNVLTPTARAMQTGNFPANPNHAFCTKDYCQYWDICRKTGEIK